MRLHDLLEGFDVVELRGDRDVEVRAVGHDSRQVDEGTLFCCIPGKTVDGHGYAVAAERAGASAFLVERFVDVAGPQVRVASVRAAVGPIAARLLGDPSRAMTVLGVTGTNGKTTVSYLVEAGLRAAGHVTGLVGTVETRVAGQVMVSERTTPEAPDVQALLALMVERGCSAAAMEVSSHALALGRVDAISFDVAVFTNLTQDHLDFHPTFEEYYRAKASLFTGRRARLGVVNLDDQFGRRLVSDAATPVTTYSTTGAGADWRAEDVQLGQSGSSFRVVGPAGERAPARVALPGAFNVSNALAAVVALHAAGVPLHAAVAGVGGLSGVPGRMQRVDAGQPFLALVDYAHTPDAVSTLLDAVRSLVPGRVIVVLGCGGDRDRLKRPMMGAAAVSGSDLAFLTSDNPRSEDPGQILSVMASGAASVSPAAGRWQVEPDRRAAIAAAVGQARAADVVVVAGKGHELGQEVAGSVLPFDDRIELRAAIEELAVVL